VKQLEPFRFANLYVVTKDCDYGSGEKYNDYIAKVKRVDANFENVNAGIVNSKQFLTMSRKL